MCAKSSPVGNQLLPEPIVARMVQPAHEDRDWLAVEPTEIPVGLAAAYHFSFERAPLRRRRQHRPIRRESVRRAVTEPVSGIAEDVACHGNIDSGRGGAEVAMAFRAGAGASRPPMRQSRCSCRRTCPRGRRSRAAWRSNRSRTRILAVVLIGNDSDGDLGVARGCKRTTPDIAVRRALLGVVCGGLASDVNSSSAGTGLAALRRAHQHRRDMLLPSGCCDQHLLPR